MRVGRRLQDVGQSGLMECTRQNQGLRVETAEHRTGLIAFGDVFQDLRGEARVVGVQPEEAVEHLLAGIGVVGVVGVRHVFSTRRPAVRCL